MDTYALIFDGAVSEAQVKEMQNRGLSVSSITHSANDWTKLSVVMEWYGEANNTLEAALRISEELEGLSLPTFSIEWCPQFIS